MKNLDIKRMSPVLSGHIFSSLSITQTFRSKTIFVSFAFNWPALLKFIDKVAYYYCHRNFKLEIAKL